MSVDDLLAGLEPLSHGARCREVIARGRASAQDPSLAALLTALQARGFYGRYLALTSCFGSRDGGQVLLALADPSQTIRRLAFGLVPLACDDDQAHRALLSLHPADRFHLARRLRKAHRLTPIDTALQYLAAAGDRTFTDLLPFCSTFVVDTYLDQARQQAGLAFWRRLARQHPDRIASLLLAQVTTMQGSDPRLLWQINAVLPVLATARPDAALHLAQTLAVRIPLQRLDLNPVLGQRPGAIIDLALRSRDTVSLALGPVVARLDLPRLLALLERMPAAHQAVRQRFASLAPTTRARLFQTFGVAWRDPDGCVDVAVLRALPIALRLPEARRHLALAVLATRPLQRLPYAGLLPWDEAYAVLAPYLGSPDPDVRVTALPALAATVRYERGRAVDLLALVRSRHNEQDPVRLAMLGGLADLPPGIWLVAHLDDLGGVIRAALDAANLSHATASVAGRLVLSLFPHHPAWATAWLATLVAERGYLPGGDLESRLTDADITTIAPVLLPVLETWTRRERQAQLLQFAESLGRRLRLFDGLAELLARLCHSTRESWTANSALSLLRRHQPARFAILVPDLLSADKSVVTLPTVWSYLHRRRQDLLTPYLGQHAYPGRFTTGQTRIVLPFSSGFQRWTQSQRDLFAVILREITHRNPGTRETPTILAGINQLSALQGVPPTHLIRLARRTDLSVRDAALRALGTLDDATEALPALLAAMDDDRARVAVYALRRALLRLSVEQAIATLRTVPLDRVTVAKEVARLYGDLPGQEAFAELAAMARRDLHRDVRVALLRALWGHLDRSEAWELLEAAATSPDAALARSTMRIPADTLSSEGQRRLVGLLGTLLAHPDPVVRVAVVERCGSLPVADPARLLLTRLLDRLGSPLPDERMAAARAVFTLCEERDAAQIGATVTGLLPDRRALLTVIDVLLATVSWSYERLLPVSRAVLAVLSTDRVAASLQVRVGVAGLPWDEVGVLLQRLAGLRDLHADALMAACASLAQAAQRPDNAGLDDLERRLAASTDPALRRVGLAMLVGSAGSLLPRSSMVPLLQLALPGRGWDMQRLDRLRLYRQDPDPLVAAAAQFTLPAEELEA